MKKTVKAIVEVTLTDGVRYSERDLVFDMRNGRPLKPALVEDMSIKAFTMSKAMTKRWASARR
jgi:hypothetical protein